MSSYPSSRQAPVELKAPETTIPILCPPRSQDFEGIEQVSHVACATSLTSAGVLAEHMDVDETPRSPAGSVHSEAVASTAPVRELPVANTLPELSVLIPAFNEAENLASVLPELREALAFVG